MASPALPVVSRVDEEAADVQPATPDGTVTITISNAGALALAAELRTATQPEAVALRERLIGSPAWRTDAGEGVRGIFSAAEFTSFLAARGIA